MLLPVFMSYDIKTILTRIKISFTNQNSNCFIQLISN